MTLKPIPGGPIGAPIPDFPTGEPGPTDEAKEFLLALHEGDFADRHPRQPKRLSGRICHRGRRAYIHRRQAGSRAHLAAVRPAVMTPMLAPMPDRAVTPSQLDVRSGMERPSTRTPRCAFMRPGQTNEPFLEQSDA